MSNTPEYGQAHGALTRAASMVSDAKADFVKISATLSDQIQSVQGKWGGQGAQAFFVLHQTWTEKQRTIVNALDDFSHSLTSTEKLNTSNDENVGATYSHLSNRLG
jgi:WXG100 family type VII secretion target